jgi:hypothetical protein
VSGYWLILFDRSGLSDWIALGAALAVGLVGVWLAPWRKEVKATVALPYFGLMGMALLYGLIALECSTGNCL